MSHDPRDLLPFVTAARLGGFSAAARTMHVTPSAVSKAIARFEADVGTRLFNRNTRLLQLTEAGQALYDSLAPAMERIRDAVDAAAEIQRGPVGTVRISTISSFGKFFLMPLLKPLQAKYPRINLELQFDDGTPDMISEGFDIVVRRGHPHGARTVARKLATFPLVLLATPEYLRVHGAPAKPQDLAHHECVCIRFPSGKYAKWRFSPKSARGAGGEASYTHVPNGRLVVSEQPVDALVAAAEMGCGIVAIAASFVMPQLRSGTLKVVLSDYQLEKAAEVYLQYPHRELLAPKVQAVADFLMEKLREDERLTVKLSDLARYAVT